jgi:hypothetical protein
VSRRSTYRGGTAGNEEGLDFTTIPVGYPATARLKVMGSARSSSYACATHLHSVPLGTPCRRCASATPHARAVFSTSRFCRCSTSPPLRHPACSGCLQHRRPLFRIVIAAAFAYCTVSSLGPASPSGPGGLLVSACSRPPSQRSFVRRPTSMAVISPTELGRPSSSPEIRRQPSRFQVLNLCRTRDSRGADWDFAPSVISHAAPWPAPRARP